MQLYRSVIHELFAKHSLTEWSAVVSAAMRIALEGPPALRMQMMQKALPLTEEPLVTIPNVSVDEGLEREFNQYCEGKKLHAEVLLAGSVLHLIGVETTKAGEVMPNCPEVAPTASNISAPAAKKPWWKVW